MFEEMGEMKSFQIRDNRAFVEYENYVSANQAIRKYDGIRLDGHTITVHSISSQRRSWWSNDDTVTYQYSKSNRNSANPTEQSFKSAQTTTTTKHLYQHQLNASRDLTTTMLSIRPKSARINKKHSIASITTTSSAPQSLNTMSTAVYHPKDPFGDIRVKTRKQPNNDSQSVAMSAEEATPPITKMRHDRQLSGLTTTTITTRATDKDETYSNFIQRMTKEALKSDDDLPPNIEENQRDPIDTDSQYADKLYKQLNKPVISRRTRGSIKQSTSTISSSSSASSNNTMSYTDRKLKRHTNNKPSLSPNLDTRSVMEISPIHPPPADVESVKKYSQKRESYSNLLDRGNGCKLLIGNVPTNMALSDVKEEIQLLTQKRIKSLKQSLGFYVITFNSIQDAQNAEINLRNAECGGKMITVEDMIRCGSCNQEWDTNEPMIQCENKNNSQCDGSWFHTKCVFENFYNDAGAEIFICSKCQSFNNDKDNDNDNGSGSGSEEEREREDDLAEYFDRNPTTSLKSGSNTSPILQLDEHILSPQTQISIPQENAPSSPSAQEPEPVSHGDLIVSPPADEDSEEKTRGMSMIRLKPQQMMQKHIGHESERYLHSIDIEKLYRWANDEWRIRTEHSKLEFYQHKQSAKIRIIARDPVTFKLRLNHWIPASKFCCLKRKPNTELCWQWNAFDATVMRDEIDDNTYSFGRNTRDSTYIFCAKFHNAKDSDKFYNFFVNMQKSNHLLSVASTSTSNPTDHEISDEKTSTSTNIKRDTSNWSSWDEREMIKLRSIEMLTWDKIGDLLKRSGDSCKQHWNVMKSNNCIPLHIEFIKRYSDNNDKEFKISRQVLLNQQSKLAYDEDADVSILLAVDETLKQYKWNIDLLDSMWNDIQQQPVNIAMVDDVNSDLRLSNLTVSDQNNKDDEKISHLSLPLQVQWTNSSNDSIKLNAIKQNSINIQELMQLKNFYTKCLSQPENAEFLHMPHDFQGDEVYNYCNVDQTDTEQLTYTVNSISQRISELQFKDWSKGYTQLPNPAPATTSSLGVEQSVVSGDTYNHNNKKSIIHPVFNGGNRMMGIPSDIAIPINGQLIIKLTPIGYGVTLNIQSKCTIRNIKTLLTQKLGIEVYDQTIVNKFDEGLDDKFVIREHNMEHNQILYLSMPELKYDGILYQNHDSNNNINDHHQVSKLWKITTVIGGVELNIELSSEERKLFYSVNDLKKKIFSVCNIPIPKQELYLENRMLSDQELLTDLEEYCNVIRLLFVADQHEMPIFVKYHNQYVFLCLNAIKDPLSVISVMLNISQRPSDLMLLCDDIILDPTQNIKYYSKVLDAESVINVMDNSIITIKIHCMCISNQPIQLQIRKCQSIKQLKRRILHHCNIEINSENDQDDESKDDVKSNASNDDNDDNNDEKQEYQGITLKNMKLFSCLEHEDLTSIQDRLSDETLYRSVINYSPRIYKNDKHKLCHEHFYNNKVLGCIIEIRQKIKILFPKNVLKSRIKTFMISSFDPYLTELYEHISKITNIDFNNMILYSPDLKKHIKPDWSGQKLIGQHLRNNNINNNKKENIILYFMNIPKVMEEIEKPPKMLNISLKIDDQFYCKKYHDKIIPFMINLSQSIADFKQEICEIFSFFGQLKLLKNSKLRMDYDDNKLLSDYYLRYDDIIEICVVHPNQFQIFVKIMNGYNLSIMVTPYETIQMLINKINMKTKQNSLSNVKKIIFMGQELNNLNKTIAEYSIKRQSTIHAVLRLNDQQNNNINNNNNNNCNVNNNDFQ